MTLITLLTDFGLKDEYVGVMKGVIAGIHADARMVDITHHIEPQDVIHGAFILAASFPYFPRGTIHVAVVDPGVGTGRRILAVEAAGHCFLAPDNGLLERVLSGRTDVRSVAIENQNYFLAPVSQTFHGRDVFAPVAAHLARGVPFSQLGPRVDPRSMVSGVVPRCRFRSKQAIEGVIVAIDRFGNLLTNIDGVALERLERRIPGSAMAVKVAEKRICGIATAYQEKGDQALLAIVGSRGLLEISVNRGNAQRLLGVHKNDRVRVGAAF